MKLLDQIWMMLGRAVNLGVTPEMPRDYVRHARIFNLIAFLALLTTVAWQISCLVERKFAFFGVMLGSSLLILVFVYLNAKGRHVLSMLLGLGCLLTYQFVMTVFVDDPQVNGYYMFLIDALVPFFIFPRSRRKLILGASALAIVVLHLALALRGQFGHPLLIETLPVAQFNTMTNYTIFLLFVMVIATNRYFLDAAETRLVEERDKVTRLSAKLRLFLPRQFVESMVSGDRDTELDYRRKKLTIFFSDVKGFTKWTDSLEPEEVRDLLNRYISEMSDIAAQWRGTIDKFIGDAMMVFFGDPEFTDDRDHALRCVKMAMEMQARMAELRGEWQKLAYDESLNIRIGINTGWATVGNFGSRERLNYTALGSAVNLASRLEGVSAPDKITISHDTYLLVRDEIECEPRGEIAVKGFAEPVKIYEVSGLKAGPPRPDRATGEGA